MWRVKALVSCTFALINERAAGQREPGKKRPEVDALRAFLSPGLRLEAVHLTPARLTFVIAQTMAAAGVGEKSMCSSKS